MKKTITLESGKTVDLAANAATPFRFKQLFNADLLKIFQQGSKSEDDHMMLADVVTQLAFIMSKQAAGTNMSALSIEDFYEWLEDYEPLDFVVKSEEIINTYVASTMTSVDSKKK